MGADAERGFHVIYDNVYNESQQYVLLVLGHTHWCHALLWVFTLFLACVNSAVIAWRSGSRGLLQTHRRTWLGGNMRSTSL